MLSRLKRNIQSEYVYIRTRAHTRSLNIRFVEEIKPGQTGNIGYTRIKYPRFKSR